MKVLVSGEVANQAKLSIKVRKCVLSSNVSGVVFHFAILIPFSYSCADFFGADDGEE